MMKLFAKIFSPYMFDRSLDTHCVLLFFLLALPLLAWLTINHFLFTQWLTIYSNSDNLCLMCHDLMILSYTFETLLVIVLKTYLEHSFVCHKQQKCLFKGNNGDTKRWISLVNVLLGLDEIKCFVRLVN